MDMGEICYPNKKIAQHYIGWINFLGLEYNWKIRKYC